MLNEVFKRFPEMIQALLKKASEAGSNETPGRKMEREKLIARLQSCVEEMSRLSQQPGEKLTEEQIQKIMNIPRPEVNIPWNIITKIQEQKR